MRSRIVLRAASRADLTSLLLQPIQLRMSTLGDQEYEISLFSTSAFWSLDVLFQISNGVIVQK